MTAPITIAALRRRRLGPGFYRRDPATLARALLGCALVHGERAAMIVETEAYGGVEDLASHARFGPTERNRVMFGPGGVSYVYLCYGMHQMFNIVGGRDGQPGAVLIRAAAPLSGIAGGDDVLRGPGKLTRALAIGKAQDRQPLVDHEALFVARYRRIAGADVAIGPRVGIDYAGPDWAARPLRFWIAAHPAVSRTRAARGA